jgi:hypothetical protein
MSLPQALVGLLAIPLTLLAPMPRQDAGSEDIETARIEMQKRWGTEGLVKPATVDAMAEAIFKLPISEQPGEQLAKQANAAANYVGAILEEYASYYRENYKYDFVQSKVAPFHDAYVRLTNRLKDHRNQAYFNLGVKAAARGDDLAAFLFFRDAYRLSTFTEDEGDHKGMRYMAELEMKKLLGIEDMGTFTYWQ